MRECAVSAWPVLAADGRVVAVCKDHDAAVAATRLLHSLLPPPHPFDYATRIKMLEDENRELNRRLAALDNANYCWSCGSPGKCGCSDKWLDHGPTCACGLCRESD